MSPGKFRICEDIGFYYGFLLFFVVIIVLALGPHPACSRLTPCSGLRNYSCWGFRVSSYGVLGMEPKLAACKANTLSNALSLRTGSYSGWGAVAQWEGTYLHV